MSKATDITTHPKTRTVLFITPNPQYSTMPVITLEICPMSADKKSEIANIFTEELSRISGLPKEAIVVLFHESPYENVASGGVLLSERK